MSFAIVGLTALAAATLTFFSGFGLGTLLLPAFAAFFPGEVAVAATAVVHLANNLFKGALLGKYADRGVLLRFGAPAVAAAFVGAALLETAARAPALLRYAIGSRSLEVAPAHLLLGALMVVFAILELWPRFQTIALERKWLPLGGALSGFFGGLSGHQGALRSMFLLKVGLTKESFLATGVFVAILVDVSRLAVYGLGWKGAFAQLPAGGGPLLATATAAAIAGSLLGSHLLEKLTLGFVRVVVAVALAGFGVALAAGVLG